MSSECAPSKCATCSRKGQCGVSPEQLKMMEEIAQRMENIEHKILVLSGKGGVGKSMVSAQLAFALARQGYRVGMLDIDICGPTVPKMLGVRGQGTTKGPNGLLPVRVNENLCAMSIGFVVDDDTEPIIWRGPRKLGLIQMFLRDIDWGVLDFLIVDTPPGTSDEHISIVQLMKAVAISGAVIVTSPQDVSVVEVGKEISFCKKMGVSVLGVVENFSSFACPLCHGITEVWPCTHGGGLQLAIDHDVPFLGRVPLDPELARVGEKGVELAAMGETATAKALAAISEQVLDSVLPDRKKPVSAKALAEGKTEKPKEEEKKVEEEKKE